jgi:polyhydroxyalkanoate synthesis regulator phasin
MRGENGMQDAWRAYLELALGVTETSRRKAEKVARDLIGKGGATAAQVQDFVEDLVSASRTNREGLVKLVRYEVDRALGAVGLATADEVAELTDRVRKLEREFHTAGRAAAAATASSAGPETTGPPTTPARPTVGAAAGAGAKAAKTPAKKAAKVPAKKAVRQPAPKKTTAKKTAKTAVTSKTVRTPAAKNASGNRRGRP